MKKETVNDRVKIVRKALGMTQVDFAKKLGIHGGSLSVIELGERTEVTDQNIYLICTPNRLKEGITVNENWLRTSKGEMFETQPSAEERPRIFENGKEIPADEEELVGIYRQLTTPNKRVAKKQIDVLLEGQDEIVGHKEKGDTLKRSS